MTHNTIVTFFWITLIAGLTGGTWLYVSWLRRMWKRIGDVKRLRITEMAARTLVFSFPGFVALILCLIPAFYFNNLIKNEYYCQQLVEANPSLNPDSDIIQERCGCYDTDELFAIRNQK